MVLVSQIYAPIESDRTLYVFCCNSRACSLSSSGWMVVRNQEKSKDIPAPVNVESKSVWGDFLAPNENTTATKAASAWGDFSFEQESTDASVDALTALLQERDLSLNAKATEKKTTSTAKATTSSTSRYNTAQHLTCWEVSELEESWTAADEEAAWEGLGADEESGVSGGDEYINRLLKSYYEGEEDTEIVNIVKKQQQGGASKTSEPVSAPTSGTAKAPAEKAAKKGPVKKPSGRAEDSDGESSDGEGGEVGLARGSRRQQVEAYFQRRVSFYPTQVLRYAYGGAPLWISHPSPLDAPLPATTAVESAPAAAVVDETVFQLAETKKSKKNKPAPAGPKKTLPEATHIPRCEGCGKARVFECQLMPALLSYINTSSSSSKEVKEGKEVKESGVKDAAWNFDHPPTAADILRFQETLGDELDFGVVAIYSCPDSCANCTEVAIVQGPPDIL